MTTCYAPTTPSIVYHDISGSYFINELLRYLQVLITCLISNHRTTQVTTIQILTRTHMMYLAVVYLLV